MTREQLLALIFEQVHTKAIYWIAGGKPEAMTHTKLASIAVRISRRQQRRVAYARARQSAS